PEATQGPQGFDLLVGGEYGIPYHSIAIHNEHSCDADGQGTVGGEDSFASCYLPDLKKGQPANRKPKMPPRTILLLRQP
ncbi:MAG TPA: hypothetical protein VKB60_09630, partial [Terriglobales bacterium]|nr:hypothetical protein [Terriglobales bacterium]